MVYKRLALESEWFQTSTEPEHSRRYVWLGMALLVPVLGAMGSILFAVLNSASVPEEAAVQPQTAADPYEPQKIQVAHDLLTQTQQASTAEQAKFKTLFESGVLRDELYYTVYAPYVADEDRHLLPDYIDFCRRYREHTFIDWGSSYRVNGPDSTGNQSATQFNLVLGRWLTLTGKGHRRYSFDQDFSQFKAVADYYQPEIREWLNAMPQVALDDVVLAYRLTQIPELKEAWQDREGLMHLIQASARKGKQRTDYDPGVVLIDDLEQFPDMDLLKIFLLQQALIQDNALRRKIVDLITLDQSVRYADTELGGAVRIDPESGKLGLVVVAPWQNGQSAQDWFYTPADAVYYSSQLTFSEFHLHAFLTDASAYAGPSSLDINASAYHQHYAGTQITALANGKFNVHYYRTPKDDPGSVFVYNLGAFSLLEK